MKRRTPLRRKSQRVRSRSLLAYKRRAPIGIGPAQKAEKRRKHDHRVEVIGQNRAKVFDRDRTCRRCLAPGRADDHCHEVISRAKLRGRPPEEIFNLQNCLRVCADCHEILTRHKEDIVYADELAGCNGHVEFQPRLNFGRRS